MPSGRQNASECARKNELAYVNTLLPTLTNTFFEHEIIVNKGIGWFNHDWFHSFIILTISILYIPRLVFKGIRQH